MKKMLVTCALALAVTAAGQQRASAWNEFKFSVGFDICWRGGGNCWSWTPGLSHYSAPYPGCGFDGGGHDGFVGGVFQNYGAYGVASTWQAPAPTAQYQAPAAVAAQPGYSPYYNTGYQPVGYSYPGYSQYQSPSYWYGR
jgi:hypothetical protein